MKDSEESRPIGTTQNILLELSGKRKTWDSDVVMEDSECDLKRSCMGSRVEISISSSIVEVGLPQPRER